MGFYTFNLIAHSLESREQIKSNSSNSVKLMVVLEEQEDNDLLDGLLKKILSAINIDLSSDVCLVKSSKHLPSLNIIKSIKDLRINKVISFGLNPKDLALNFTNVLYEPIHIGDLTFLFADTLGVLNNDPGKKKALWLNLQQIFLLA